MLTDLVQVLEEQEHESGHTRVRIASDSEGAWCSRVTAKGTTLLGPSDLKGEPFVSKHLVVVFDEADKYRVVATCTIRDGCDLETADRVGEYEIGAVIDAVVQVTDWTGMKLFQTTKGWVKQ